MAKSTRRTTKIVAMPKPACATPEQSQSTNSAATDIAQRAFELYCERGCQDGQDVDDWLQAERELQAAANSTAA